MFEAIVTVCVMVMGPCLTGADDFGPYQTLEECRTRAGEMVPVVTQGLAMTYALPDGTPVRMRLECHEVVVPGIDA